MAPSASRSRPPLGSWRRNGRARGARRPHVVLVVENLPAAVDIRVRKQVHDLVGAGYEVTAIGRADPRNSEISVLPGVTVLEYPSPSEPESAAGYLREYGVSVAHAAVRLVRVRATRAVDVVQFCQPPDIYFPLAWLLRLTGVRVVIDQRDLMPELFRARYGEGRAAVPRVLHWLERRSMRVAHHAFSVNTWTRDRLVGARIPASRVTMLYNGPVLERLAEARPDPELVEDGRALCCWVGNMAQQDRVELLLDVAEHVVVTLGRSDVRFVLVGGGECLEALREQTKARGLVTCVELPGLVPQERVFTYLLTAAVGIDSSLQEEVTPVKVLEYMASGLPVVAFDLPETKAVAQGAGILVDPGDVTALAQAVVDLLDDPAERARLGAEGQRRVRERLSWERQREAYLDVMATLTGVAPR
jgi:glycosyltransferase involved in cell wall biosynthesis